MLFDPFQPELLPRGASADKALSASGAEDASISLVLIFTPKFSISSSMASMEKFPF